MTAGMVYQVGDVIKFRVGRDSNQRAVRRTKKKCASAGRPWAEKLCRIRRFLTL
jgi:hypothetical protein